MCESQSEIFFPSISLKNSFGLQVRDAKFRGRFPGAVLARRRHGNLQRSRGERKKACNHQLHKIKQGTDQGQQQGRGPTIVRKGKRTQGKEIQ